MSRSGPGTPEPAAGLPSSPPAAAENPGEPPPPARLPEGLAGDEAAWRRARELVLAWGEHAAAYQILNPGFERWLSPGRARGGGGAGEEASDGVVAYGEAAGRWVVAAGPITSPAAREPVLGAFEARARRAGRPVCYFGAEPHWLDRLSRAWTAGADRLLLGAQPWWRPGSWLAKVRGHASLRAQLHRAANKGLTVRPWSPERAEASGPLRRCLDHWLAGRRLPPLHFLVEPETLERLQDRRVVVAQLPAASPGASPRDSPRVVGFLVASPIPRRRSWLVEQIVRGPGAPNGTSESLLEGICRQLEAEGAEGITLGLSPLSSRAPREGRHRWPTPLWARPALAWVRAHGRRFYDFEGLDAFKAKFQPDAWEPVYAVAFGRRLTPADLWAVAGAFAGEPTARFLARITRRALVEEARNLTGWLARR